MFALSMAIGGDLDISETVQKTLQEVVVPGLGKIRDQNSEILAILELTTSLLRNVSLL